VIRIVDGEYRAFGQYVKIRRGELRFNMTPLDQPTLDLVGDRRSGTRTSWSRSTCAARWTSRSSP